MWRCVCEREAWTKTDATNVSLVLKGDSSLKSVLATFDVCLRLNCKADREKAGRYLLGVARQARVNRNTDAVETISDWIAERLPETVFAHTARYHKAHCFHRRGSTETARLLLHEAIALAAPAYKPRAILTLAATYLDASDTTEGADLCVAALRASRGTDVLSDLQALRNIAVTHAIRGDHKTALAMLESLLPTARTLNIWYPADFLCHLNSLAIELGEVGRVEEANRVIDSVLRSPFAKNRPQWHDTRVELATKPRLVFTPFTLALGSVAEPEETRTEDRRHLEPPVALTVATDVKQESRRRHSQQAATRNRCIDDLKISRDSAIVLFPIGTEPSMRSAAVLPVLQAAAARLAYAIFPPARAPPPTVKSASSFTREEVALETQSLPFIRDRSFGVPEVLVCQQNEAPVSNGASSLGMLIGNISFLLPICVPINGVGLPSQHCGFHHRPRAPPGLLFPPGCCPPLQIQIKGHRSTEIFLITGSFFAASESSLPASAASQPESGQTLTSDSRPFSTQPASLHTKTVTAASAPPSGANSATARVWWLNGEMQNRPLEESC